MTTKLRDLGFLLCACALGFAGCGDDTAAPGVDAGLGTAGTGIAGTNAGTGVAGTAVAGTGVAGTGVAGTGDDAGAEDAGVVVDAGPVDAGTDAGTVPTAVATIAGFGAGTVTGTATFTQNGADVTVVVVLNNCSAGTHPVHIHQGTSCADATVQGAHWDTTRGEGIPDITCASNTGTVTYTRLGSDAKPWTVTAGDVATDVDTHAFVVHDNAAVRIGCGLVTAQ